MQCLIINRRFVLAITTIAAVFFGPEVFAQTPTGTNTAPAAPLATGSGTGNVLNAPIGYFICTTTCTVTPPVPSAGYQFCVAELLTSTSPESTSITSEGVARAGVANIANDVNTVITLGALGSSAKYENTARSAYGTAGTGTLASNGAVGDMICIVGRDSTHYLSPTYVGTWTAS